MNRFFQLTCLLLMLVCQLTSCAQGKSENKENSKMETKKVLVVYFSRTGENYGVGNIKEGNTKIVAEMIATQTKGDLFEIVPEKAYPEGYDACTEVAKAEKSGNVRPAIKGDKHVEDYDVIFIGYPIWWGDAPMPVYTFIDKHQWQGKTVIPFCTHEGSGMCNEAEIKTACKGAEELKGLGIYGSTAQKQRDKAKSAVAEWLKRLSI